MMTGYRSLQQIAAKNIHADFHRVIERMAEFAAMTSPQAHTDSIEKMRKVQRRLVSYMHKEDKPK